MIIQAFLRTEDKIVVRMQKLQEKDKIDVWSGRPPLCGWPNDLFQVPAGEIPNAIDAVKNINSIFRLLHSTLCSLNNGNSLETAMGVGEVDDKFIAPGANITIMEKLYKVALGSIDSTVTVAGVAISSYKIFGRSMRTMTTTFPQICFIECTRPCPRLGEKFD